MIKSILLILLLSNIVQAEVLEVHGYKGKGIIIDTVAWQDEHSQAYLSASASCIDELNGAIDLGIDDDFVCVVDDRMFDFQD